jgi:hypothetical protein
VARDLSTTEPFLSIEAALLNAGYVVLARPIPFGVRYDLDTGDILIVDRDQSSRWFGSDSGWRRHVQELLAPLGVEFGGCRSGD